MASGLSDLGLWSKAELAADTGGVTYSITIVPDNAERRDRRNSNWTSTMCPVVEATVDAYSLETAVTYREREMVE